MESVTAFGIPDIDIDEHFKTEDPLFVYAKAYHVAGRITEDPSYLSFDQECQSASS